ncbi:MAG: thiamine diphosphokinase [Chloroflexi bacterium]|nr:thiamine diphosphokinase [Chloroflexota bacterium]
MPRMVIFANGLIPSLDSVRSLLRPDDFLIGADGGARHIMGLGLMPHLVIGDLDSLTEDELYELSSADVKIEQYPEDKNETDLELAIEYALEQRASSIIIVAALGGRMDQSFGNIALLSDPLISRTDIRLDDGAEEISFCRGQAQVNGRSGDIVSLIPWGGDVSGVTTTGLKWTLISEILYSHKTRGISNEMTGDTATVQIKSGSLLIVHRRID